MKYKGKRVTVKPHKQYWNKNVNGTIDSDIDIDSDEYLVVWDEPVQGHDPILYREGWYKLTDLIFLDRELKLKRILQIK